MVKWIVAAFPVLLLLPLSAMAAEHCPHGQNHGIRHNVHAESVENIPAASAAGPCPDHGNRPHAVNVETMPKCSMEGCCIKADGPLSAGLSNRPSASDNHALGISFNPLQTGGRLIAAAPDHWRPLRERLEPAFRPPSV